MGFRRSEVRILSPRHRKGCRDNQLRQPFFTRDAVEVGSSSTVNLTLCVASAVFSRGSVAIRRNSGATFRRKRCTFLLNCRLLRVLSWCPSSRGRHVLPRQNLRTPSLSPTRREPLGPRPVQTTG